MTVRPIGYYVHHHGLGHRSRAAAITAVSERPIVLLGTGIGEAGIELADDCLLPGLYDGRDDAGGRSGALHYAPLDHPGLRTRVARFTQWIALAEPALIVVDVSVELAMISRLASVPTVYVRLNGDRCDTAHLEAFRNASALLAPFHHTLERPGTPDWVREKTCYFPGITTARASDRSFDRRVLVVIGRGGPPGDGDRIAAAARACPRWRWRVIGPAHPPVSEPSNLTFAGWSDAPEREIAQAAIVVGAAGDGLVGAVLAAGRPFICIPEIRPYGEQAATAAGLAAAQAAVVLPAWPAAERWLDLIERALRLSLPAQQTLNDVDGARKAASWLADHAEQVTPSLEYAG